MVPVLVGWGHISTLSGWARDGLHTFPSRGLEGVGQVAQVEGVSLQ